MLIYAKNASLNPILVIYINLCIWCLWCLSDVKCETTIFGRPVTKRNLWSIDISSSIIHEVCQLWIISLTLCSCPNTVHYPINTRLSDDVNSSVLKANSAQSLNQFITRIKRQLFAFQQMRGDGDDDVGGGAITKDLCLPSSIYQNRRNNQFQG